MKTTKTLRQVTDAARVHLFGAMRRVAVTLTARALWQVSGHIMPDGRRETFEAEPFLGVGFHSRPPANGKPEAIVLMLGDDARAPVVVAVRDEKTRQAIANALAEDETAIFNSKALVLVKADGTVEVRTASGAAVPLALKSDVEAVDAKYSGHLHVAAGAATGGPISAFDPGPPPVSSPLPPADIVGTTTLKGE